MDDKGGSVGRMRGQEDPRVDDVFGRAWLSEPAVDRWENRISLEDRLSVR